MMDGENAKYNVSMVINPTVVKHYGHHKFFGSMGDGDEAIGLNKLDYLTYKLKCRKM